MALTQRLEIRQSQALVMTPQLMQAIKLLQLSNLDLAAYVEGELERNPLLERVERRRRAGARRRGQTATASERRRRRCRTGRTGSAPDLETSRSSIEQGLGTDLDNVFPDDDAATSRSNRRGAAAGLFRMGGRRLRRPRRRRLQSRSLRFGRDHARRPSRRAAGAGDRRSGRPHDRAIPDRSGRRGRLPHRRSRGGRRKARRAGAADVEAVLAVLQAFDPPGVCARNLTECLAHPAQGAQPLRSRDAGAGRASRSAGQARPRRPCAASAASTTKISPT